MMHFGNGDMENKLKSSTPVTDGLGNVPTNYGFLTPFCVQVRCPYGTERERQKTDGRTGNTYNATN